MLGGNCLRFTECYIEEGYEIPPGVTQCYTVLLLCSSMCMVLHQHSHGHSGHGHSHGINLFKRKRNRNSEETQRREAGEGRGNRQGKKKVKGVNINVQAAFIHVIGDLIQSIGVVIAGYVIYFTVSGL